MSGLPERARFLQELLVAEVLALPGRSPLARRRWPSLGSAAGRKRVGRTPAPAGPAPAAGRTPPPTRDPHEPG